MEKRKSKSIPLALSLTPPKPEPPTISLNYQPLSDEEIKDLVTVARDRLYTKETVHSRPKAHSRLSLVSHKSLELPLMNLICGPRVIAMMEEVVHLRAAVAHLEQQVEQSTAKGTRTTREVPVLQLIDLGDFDAIFEGTYFYEGNLPHAIWDIFDETFTFRITQRMLPLLQTMLGPNIPNGTGKREGNWFIHPKFRASSLLQHQLQIVVFLNPSPTQPDYFIVGETRMSLSILIEGIKRLMSESDDEDGESDPDTGAPYKSKGKKGRPTPFEEDDDAEDDE